MQRSILEAIREGEWDFEPEQIKDTMFDSTVALPGTEEKLSVLAERAKRGLPLWHSSDRLCYEERSE
ncbi:MAG: hypothetical protein KDA37_15690 [Planctomycetales bacterium]|nr:hypothetical protein [Planctomycetales bacterium]